jgi:antitoxin (DNA-binding transcriptional repressor) of toxin-antitoxin stability system
MKFVSIRDLRGKSAEVWKKLPGEGEMIITSNGRPIAILAAVNESNLEEFLRVPQSASRGGGGEPSAKIGGAGDRQDHDG